MPMLPSVDRPRMTMNDRSGDGDKDAKSGWTKSWATPAQLQTGHLESLDYST